MMGELMTRKIAGMLLGGLLLLGFAGVAEAGSIDTLGNVFVAIGNGQVNEYTPNGTLVQTLNDTTGSFETTGMAFDSSGNLYVTNFSSGGTVSQFSSGGTLMNASFISGQANPESIAVDKTGNFYIGDASLGQINQYNSSGVLTGTTTAARQDRGTDWIDLAADQKTILYTSEGTSILSVNTATNMQNANFANGLPGSSAYALRIVPGGAFAGDVLVADSSNALLIDTSGIVIKTYTLPGNGGVDFALNIDPNGTDFWTADESTGEVWEVNIATGAIDEMWNANVAASGGSDAAGLVVFGQLTASGGGGGTVTPEPGSISLVLTGLAGAALRKLRRR
jgi:streptogramin lyase